MSVKIRKYQKDWINRAEECALDRVLLVGPTGSGKTVVAAHLAAKQPKRVLFVVHRREHAYQAKLRLLDAGVPVRRLVRLGYLEKAPPLPADQQPARRTGVPPARYRVVAQGITS